ncbi:Ig domain-containing protein [Spirosoma soli]|uniref:Ig domain-containing protein n=1 Tax=Spirosoma soli TaxID=1770529 RepID=A0ABW5M4P2_9BACT
MKNRYPFWGLTWVLGYFMVFTGYAGTPTCNPPTGMDPGQAVRTSTPDDPRAARKAAPADLSYANLSASAQARLRKEASGTVSDDAVTIDREDYLRFAKSGNQIIQQSSRANDAFLDMNIGPADDQQPQSWTLPAGFQSIFDTLTIGDFVAPEQVPADLRIDEATHIIRINSDGGIMYRAYQLKDTEVEALGYSVDSLQGADFKEDNDDLGFSKYSDVPLNLGDEFLSIYEEYLPDRSERHELHSGTKYDAFGTLTTPAGTFDALRFSTRDTLFFFMGKQTNPFRQRYSERVGWITKTGIYFDGEVRSYNPATGEAGLALVNYQTIRSSIPPASLSVSLTANPGQLLVGETTALTATVGGGTPPYSYSYVGAGVMAPNSSTAFVSGLGTGVNSFTVLVSDASLPVSQTATATVSVTVSAVGTASFAITGVNMVNCQLIDEARGGYRVEFTPQYSGANSNPINFSVVNEMLPTTQPAPYNLRLYTDNPAITLVANQAGNPEARFAYQWLVSCQTGATPNQPPVTSGVPSQTLLQGQPYQLDLTSYFSDPDAQRLNFTALGLPAGLSLSGSLISGTPSQTGVSTVRITALDPGRLSVATRFELRVNPPLGIPTGFAITEVSTVSCDAMGVDERRVTFTPQYAGVSGEPVSFSVVNELLPTTEPGPYSLRLYTDNPVITLSARQGSTVSKYVYNWLVACSTARIQSETGSVPSGLQVRVLGNPVETESAEVDISGVTGQTVLLRVSDMQGRILYQQTIPQAQAHERASLSLDNPGKVLILQVNTRTERQQIKLLKP